MNVGEKKWKEDLCLNRELNPGSHLTFVGASEIRFD